MTPRPATRQAPLLFSLAAAILGYGLARVAADRDGSARQLLAWESADFFAHAVELKRALFEGGLTAFVERWFHVSGTHTPLVPAVSAISMGFLGETRFAAELALPLFTFVLCLSVVRLTKNLYPGSTWTPYAAAALLLTFPIAVNQSRMYLFEGALAASAAAACWAMSASDFGARRVPMLAFGLATGLTFVARAMGGAALAGPVLVFTILAFRQGDRVRRAVNFALAAAVAAAVAAPWYVVNGPTLRDYLWRVTYGDLARVQAGTERAFSLDNGLYALQWNALDGAGIPILAIASICYWTACARERRLVKSPTQLALGAAWILSFAVLLAGSQRVGAKFFLSILWIQALAVVRAIALVRPPSARAAVSSLTAALAGYHLWALTFGFSLEPGGRPSPGPFGPSFPFWNHDPHFVAICQAANADPRARYPVAETVDRLERILTPLRTAGPTPLVHVLSQHPFYNESNLRLEALLRRQVLDCPSLGYFSRELDEFQLDRVRAQLLEADAIVARPNIGFARDESDEIAERILAPLAGGDPAPFAEELPAIPLPDGSQARILVRRPDATFLESAPAVNIMTPASFQKPSEPSQVLELVGANFHGGSANGVPDVVDLVFRAGESAPLTPDVFLHLLDANGGLLRPIHLDPARRVRAPSASHRALRVRYRLRNQIPPQLRLRGFAIAVGILADDGLTRWKVSPIGNTTVDARESRVLLFSPFAAPGRGAHPR